MDFSMSSKQKFQAALQWPKVVLYLVKQIGQQDGPVQTGVEVAAAIPPVGGALAAYVLSGPEPVLNLVTFYAAGAGLTYMLPEITGAINKRLGTVIAVMMTAAMKPAGGGTSASYVARAAPTPNVAGPTALRYNTASRYDKRPVLPRYPFASGQHYALQNDGGTTWANMRKH